MNIIDSIKNYILKPSQFFEMHREKPKYLIHFIIIGIITLITAIVTNYKQIQFFNNNAGKDMIDLGSANAMTGINSSAIFISIGSIIGFVIGIYIASGIYYAIITGVLKGEGKFSHLVFIVLVTSYPKSIVGLINVFLKKDFSGITTLTDSILSYINIPSLWSLVLMIIGTSVLFNISKKKSAIFYSIIFIIGLAFTVGAFALTSNMVQNLNNM